MVLLLLFVSCAVCCCGWLVGLYQLVLLCWWGFQVVRLVGLCSVIWLGLLGFKLVCLVLVGGIVLLLRIS